MYDLISLYYPQQLLPALAAVKCWQKQKQFQIEKLIVFVYLPNGLAATAKSNRKAFFKKALSVFQETKLVFSDEIMALNQLGHFTSVLKKAKILKQHFGAQTVARFYYSHDLTSDFMSQAFMQAYPNAYKVSFGDGFGLFYDQKHFDKQFFPINDFSLSSIKNCFRRLKRIWSLSTCPTIYEADVFLGILPQEASPHFFKAKHVETIDKAMVLDLNQQFLDIFADEYLVYAEEKQKYVFLMGSYSESKLMSLEQELDLYMDVFAKHIPKNSTVFLKSHPGAHQEKFKLLIPQLENEYELFETPASELPIEWMSNLLKNAKVVSFSYASISLKYFYDIKVIHALNQELIHLYFYTKSILWVSVSNQMYLDKIRDLEKG
jgi:Alpha-2,8-polysialyltransferase (POLYST)